MPDFKPGDKVRPKDPRSGIWHRPGDPVWPETPYIVSRVAGGGVFVVGYRYGIVAEAVELWDETPTEERLRRLG